MSNHVITNPSAIPSGQAVLATNLATNPSFETASGAVEVWRNLALNPNAVSATGFSPNNGAVHTVVKENVGTSGNAQGIGTRAKSTLVTGQVSPFIMSMYNIDGLSASGPARTIGAWFYVSASGYQVKISGTTGDGTYVPLAPAAWTWITGTSGAGQQGFAFVTKVTGNAGASDIAYITGVTALAGGIVPVAAIAPGTPYPSAAAPDPDLTASWTGTANSSESILSGVAAVSPGLGNIGSDGTSFPIQSSQWSKSGGKSLRLIPRNVSDYAYFFVQNLTPGQTYTALVTFYQDKVQTGPDSPSTRRMDYQAGTVQASVQAENIEGEQKLRLTFTAADSGTRLLVFRGHVGNGVIGVDRHDTWWDDLLIVEGEYDGDYFDGSTPGDGEDITYTWTGTPNASTSRQLRQLWVTPPRTKPLAVAGYEAARESRNVIHDLLDGSIGVSYIAPRPRSGDLVTVYTDRAAAFEAYNMYAEETAFTYSSDEIPELGMTFALDGQLTIESENVDEELTVWYVRVGYQEV